MDLMSTLKVLAKKRMEISILNVENYDPEYKDLITKVADWRDKYESLDLDQEQKHIIDELLDALDNEEECQSYISYLAGMMDMVMLLDELSLIRD